MNKKGQGGLSMDTIIIAVIAIIVLLLIVTFFTGGMATIFGKIRNVFSGGTAGYDIDLAKKNCESYCERAQGLTDIKEKRSSTYCTYTFKIDTSNPKDGKIGQGEDNIRCVDPPINYQCSGISKNDCGDQPATVMR
mgnify:FL=1